MKKILLSVTIILLAIINVKAQSGIYVKPNNSYGTIFNRTSDDSTHFYPTGCGAPSLRGTDLHKSAMYFDSCSHRLWVYDPKTSSWDSSHLGVSLSVGGSDSTIYKKDGTLLGNRRVNNNGFLLTFDSATVTIRDTAISTTGKLSGHIYNFNHGVDYNDYDSLLAVHYSQNSLQGFVMQLNDRNNSDTLVAFKIKPSGFQFIDGTQGVNKVLTSDAAGNAHWVNSFIPGLQQVMDVGNTTTDDYQFSNGTDVVLRMGDDGGDAKIDIIGASTHAVAIEINSGGINMIQTYGFSWQSGGSLSTRPATAGHAPAYFLPDLPTRTFGYDIAVMPVDSVNTPQNIVWYDNNGVPHKAAVPTVSAGTYTGTSPINVVGSVISINFAAADGTTKGAATFLSADFTDNGSGLIGIDYPNGQASDASHKGFLTSTDWSAFNAKVSTTRTISTTSPLSGGGDLTANRTLSISQANTSTNGYLSSTDWNTFNNKLNLSDSATMLAHYYKSIVGLNDSTALFVKGNNAVDTFRISLPGTLPTVAGSYTPTLTNTTNVAASTAYPFQYSQVGSVVTVSGEVDIDPTSAALTVLTVTIPVTSSFANSYEAAGTASDDLNTDARIRAVSSSATVQIRFTPTDLTNRRFSVHFTYKVI